MATKFPKFPLVNLLDYLSKIPDFRRQHLRKHSLPDVLMIMIIALMGNHHSQRSMERFARNNSEELNKVGVKTIPTRSLFNRVCLNLNLDKLKQALQSWLTSNLKSNPETLREPIAIDGKCLKGTVTNYTSREQNFVSIVSSFQVQSRIVLKYEEMENKKISETKVARNLFTPNSIVTLDALHCNRITLNNLAKMNSNFVIGLKGNNSRLLSILQNLPVSKHYLSKDREIWVSQVSYKSLESLYKKDRLQTEGQQENNTDSNPINTFLRVRNIKNNQERTYVSNLGYKYKPDKYLNLVRGHWRIENLLHRERDVVFREDNHKTKYNHSAKVFAAILTATMNILNIAGFPSMTKATEYCCNKIPICLKLIGVR